MLTLRMYYPVYMCFVIGVICIGYVYNTSDQCSDRLDANGILDLESLVYEGRIARTAQEGDVVTLNIPILARNKTSLLDDEICGYTLYKDSSYLPFRVRLLDRFSGCAILEVDGPLDIVESDIFEFDIAPHDCTTGKHARREHIAVSILNSEVSELSSSQLSQDSYLVEVEEGHLYQEILRLDVTYSNNQVATTCSFQLLTEQVPFIIEGQGILRNTEPLDYSENHNFILTVRLHNCGLDPAQSDSIIINIKVTEACRPGWKGISDRIEYSPNGKTILLGEEAHLETCDATCTERVVSTKIHLTTRHIGKGCDRDTYSIQSQRKLCGASSGSVDLLPNPAVSSWTRSLPTDDGQEADQIFSFDGASNAIEIPSTKFNHSLEEHFTIATWMKHEQDSEEVMGEKQHILCNSDGEQMNRHHYALFVHNCRLVFLMRQEADGNDLNAFKPAEWRYKIPQVCDGNWHHYALSVDFPQARLYIDGKLLVVDGKNNPEVIDDWPLHPTNKIHFTKLVVGACWRGGDMNLSQYFNGYLAGLTILRGKTESERVIQCLNNCKENLEFHAMAEMQTGMSVAFNSEMTEITINGHNGSEVESLVKRVGYLNSRMFPTPGHRNLRVETTVNCTDSRTIEIPTINGMIVVLQSDNPIISLHGIANLARNEHDFIHGQQIFPDLTISASTETELQESDDVDMDSIEQYQLDSCIIRAEPALDLDVEHFRLPANLMSQHGLEASLSAENIIITGIDGLLSYAEILREVQYVSRQPEELNSRTFSLTCSELNGRFVSNELRVKVDVVHTYHQEAPPQAHMEEASMNLGAERIQSLDGFNEIRLQEKSANFLKRDLPAASGVGLTVIIVVCVGFLLFMIVLGVIRIRAAHQRTQVVTVDGEREMEWDNSALTIRVNPLEVEAGSVYHAENELNALRGDDTDSDDDYDGSSFHDEMESSDEEHEKVKEKDLEWDDSTLTF